MKELEVLNLMVSDTTLIKITAIASITAIEIANILVWRVDGAILGLVIASISGLAGYEIGKASAVRRRK